MSIFIITLYIAAMAVIFVFSAHALCLVYLGKKYTTPALAISKSSKFTHKVTIQLPIYNEFYVAERLINKVCEIEYPQHLVEIQVLDDSTDETKNIVKKIVADLTEQFY